jgi:hypothetical protein
VIQLLLGLIYYDASIVAILDENRLDLIRLVINRGRAEQLRAIALLLSAVTGASEVRASLALSFMALFD